MFKKISSSLIYSLNSEDRKFFDAERLTRLDKCRTDIQTVFSHEGWIFYSIQRTHSAKYIAESDNGIFNDITT
jgi:hypothetical protein